MKKKIPGVCLWITVLLLLQNQSALFAQKNRPHAENLVRQKMVFANAASLPAGAKPPDLYLYRKPAQLKVNAPVGNVVNSCLADTIILTSQAEIDNFAANYPACTNPKYLFIDGTNANPAITNLNGLSGLTQVINKLRITQTSISNLSQLTNITSIESLELHQNTALTSIGLNNLTTLNYLDLRGLTALSNINGLSNHITTISEIRMDTTNLSSLSGLSNLTDLEFLEIMHTPIPDLSSLTNITHITYLSLQNDQVLTGIGLSNITSMNGLLLWNIPSLLNLGPLSYKISSKEIFAFNIYNTGLTDLTGLDSLTRLESIFLGGNLNLSSLHGLEKITAMDNGLSIWYNDNLTDISALSNVVSIFYDRLEVSGNSSLSSLNGLGNLQTIGGGLWLQDNQLLTSLSALNNNLDIQSNSGNPDNDTLRINNNYQLEVCSSPPICNFLATHSSAASIDNNAPGCNDIGEIQTACATSTCTGGMLKTWNGNFSIYWNDSTNWSPVGVPAACDTVLIPSGMPVYPQLGNSVKIKSLIMQPNSYWDCQFAPHVIINGDFKIDQASIGFADSIIINAPEKVYIESSNIQFGNGIIINNYSDSLLIRNNTIDGNVIISDTGSRLSASTFYGNTVNGDLSITANSIDTATVFNISQVSDDNINGNFSITVNSPSNINLGSSDPQIFAFKVRGDVLINSNFPGYPIIKNIYFTDPNISRHITQAGTAPLIIQKAELPGIRLILDQDLHVTNRFRFTSGRVRTTNNKLLIFENNTTWSIYNSGSYTWGPVKKVGNQGFYFPVGDSLYQRPFAMSAPLQPTDAFTAEYAHTNPSTVGYDTSLHASSLSRILSREYFTLNRINGNSKVKLSIDYDTLFTGPITSPYDLRLAHWNGSQWDNLGLGQVEIFSNHSGRIHSDSVSVFGAFALGVAPHRIPIITIASADTIGCAGYNTSFIVHFTLDTATLSSNIFQVQLSDSSGSFASNQQIGQKATTHSDSIVCSMPPNVPYGTNYSIRIVGNSPPDTSASIRFTVLPFPFPSLVVHGESVGCIGGGIYKYWVTPVQQGVTYNWSLNNNALGTITSNYDTAYVTWTNPGYLTVQVQNANRCTTGNFAFLSVMVSPGNPTAAPVITNAGRWIFASTPAANQNATGYHWYNNNILISGANGNTYYASAAGNFTVKYYNACGEGAASNVISFAAASLPQTINFPVIPNKVYTDAAFAPGATASSGLPVSYIILSGPATYNSQTNLVTIIGTGVVTIKASQAGNNIYDTAAPVTKTFTINKGAQVVTFNNIPDQYMSVGTVTLTASSSSGLPVSYSIVSGPATVSGNTLTLTGIGTITVRASQSGDTNYLPATTVDRSFCCSVSALSHISGYTNLCPGTATYTVNNIPGATYLWRIVGGSTLPSTTNSANVTWVTPGIYQLLVSAGGNCGTASTNDTLVVHVINSILPDSVHGMLPANGAISQQLPLTLSWIPAQPGNFYTFDLYIWQANASQPNTPYAAGLTAVNYTIPVSSGLLSNTAYKWMVVAHNGSCVQINTGPVQQFTLIPLPDLVVQNVQAPATAFSGQIITINWTVKNNGPGNTTTNQNWTDAVFMSFDSLPNFNLSPETNPGVWNQLQFPVRPLLIATRLNVSALNQGEQYSNSLNFTLPLNYSQPLYVYVIANYPAGIYAPQQVNYANDTARAPQPIIVTLSPTPDLRVDSVFASNSTFSGSTIHVTYKVKNYGVVTPAGAYWYDKFYLSQTAIFNPATAVLLNTPLPSGRYYECNQQQPFAAFVSVQLNADSSYTNVVQLAIPNFINGPYFIHVLTNATNSLYEGALNNNNSNSKQVQVFLTPTPQLDVSGLTVPLTAASTTQPISVYWNVKNNGFYDNIERNQGHHAIKGAYCGDFLVGYTPPTPPPGNQPIYIPGFIYADSIGWGSSYFTDKVYLSRDSGNINNVNLVVVGALNHGSASSAVPCYTLGCLPGGYPSYYDRNVGNVIRPNTDYPGGLQIVIPDTLSEGNYYVYVLANANRTVYEYPGLPKYKISGKISITKPDLIPPVVSVPSSVVGGQAFYISYTITNTGPGSIYNHARNDKIYVSTSPVFNGSAQLISTQTYIESLPVGTAVPHSFAYTFLPSTSGTRYFFVHTNPDSLFRETNSGNNISTAAVISVTPGAPADFVVTTVHLADTVYSVYPANIKYTVNNIGSGTATGAWIDSIFISCSPVFNPATSYYILRRAHSQSLPPASSYSDSFNVNMPIAFWINNCFPQTYFNNAYFYVKTNADNGAYEGANTGNNIGGSGLKTVFNPLVDHIVTTVTGPDTARVGQLYTANWTVKNIGYNAGGYNYVNWPDGVFFSPDSVINGNAVLAGYNLTGILLNHNQTYSDTKNVITPNLSTGNYYVYAFTNYNNSIPAEIITNNNYNLIRNASGAAKQIYVVRPLQPDLTDSILSAPVSVATGQPLTVVHRVTNNGAGDTYPVTWSDDLWLSSDFIPGNAGDILLSAKNHSGILQPNQFYTDTLSAPVSLNVVPGNYVLISRTNATGNVFESNPDNNLSFRYINVYRPAPADLIVENIMKPDTVFLGYNIDTAKWVVKNNSPNAATGYSSDGIYLSQSNTLDSTAVLMGIKTKNINMGPLSRDTISLRPLVTNVTEGNYNVLVRTDLLNNIYESDKTNNTGVSITPIYVSVKELPLNVLTLNTLFTIDRFYKLIIPDSLSGATIFVTLKSGDSLSMKNQLFIGKGYVPSAAHFDYTYSTPNYGNQDIIMTTVTAGVYYITIRNVSQVPVVQNITLKAVKLPFTILNVHTPSGGNIGNVTVKISGSLYINNMVATLTKPGTIITASTVYYSNSTTVYATFNLQGKPLGIYDVTLTKPDTSMAVLANGFSVVRANNGGLNNGGGTNTGTGNGNAPGCDPGAAGGINSQLVVEMVVPDKILAGWPFTIQINYNNPTNVDIPAQVRILYSERNIKMALTQAGLANGTTTLYLELTEQDGPPGIIRASGSGSIIIYAKAPVTIPGHTIVYFKLQ